MPFRFQDEMDRIDHVLDCVSRQEQENESQEIFRGFETKLNSKGIVVSERYITPESMHFRPTSKTYDAIRGIL